MSPWYEVASWSAHLSLLTAPTHQLPCLGLRAKWIRSDFFSLISWCEDALVYFLCVIMIVWWRDGMAQQSPPPPPYSHAVIISPWAGLLQSNPSATYTRACRHKSKCSSAGNEEGNNLLQFMVLFRMLLLHQATYTATSKTVTSSKPSHTCARRYHDLVAGHSFNIISNISVQMNSDGLCPSLLTSLLVGGHNTSPIFQYQW
jgi:hypothetical protein